LRAYPGWYLAGRGEEMLDTLLEAAADAGKSPGALARSARGVVKQLSTPQID